MEERDRVAGVGTEACRPPFRTPAAAALQRIRQERPAMIVGAGTILNRAQLEAAIAAGANFAVAPGCNPSILRAARELAFPFAPGIVTPSEIEIAVEHGSRVLKFFPAETSGGLAHLQVMAAPFAHLNLRYIPLGGISAANLSAYLASTLIASVGGSWLAKPDVIARRDWAAIEQRAAEAMAIVRAARKAAK